MSIHDIHMNPIGTCPLGLCNLLTQTCEVSRKNRRSEFDDIVSHISLAHSINAYLKNRSRNAANRARADLFTMEQS
jgi:hypothetical protein